MNNSQVDVSVYMMTYFHEKYVRQAIESVLSQKTHYNFELVISDDCSKDGTVEILKEYESKYPDIIRVNYNQVNLGIPANIFKVRTMCRGRYITNLSGDDYWINDNKIETECSFLDTHPEYSGIVSCVELRMNNNQYPYDVVPKDKSLLGKAYTIKEYEKCIPLGTHGMFMKNYFLTEEGCHYFSQAREISPFVDDAVDEVLLLRKGPVYYMDFVADAHRVVSIEDGKTNYNSRYSRIEKFRHHIDLLNGLSRKFGDEIDFSKWYANYAATGILYALISRDFKGYRQIFSTIPEQYKKPFFKGLYIRSIPFIFGIIKSRLLRN
ncbi:MAG: glycosyltransferase [Butyrivibrio sp.]|nr:glycosyltransferase [Butyrivibrio sp.]